jgi:hypothetical protein
LREDSLAVFTAAVFDLVDLADLIALVGLFKVLRAIIFKQRS